MITTTIAQSTCGTHTLSNNQQYASCSDLPQLNSFLYWTYDSTAGTANIAFRVTGVNPTSNWIAWALNPTGSGMTGAQALVAYRNSSSSIHAYTSSVVDTRTTLAQSSLSFRVCTIPPNSSYFIHCLYISLIFFGIFIVTKSSCLCWKITQLVLIIFVKSKSNFVS